MTVSGERWTRCQATPPSGDQGGGNDQNGGDGEGDPHTRGDGCRGRGCEIARPDANANMAPMAEAPVMSPRLRDRLRMPDITPRWSEGTSIMTAVLLADWNN